MSEPTPAVPDAEPEEGHSTDCDCVDCVREYPVRPDPVVDGITPECAGSQGLVVFRGFLGPGGTDDTWRLYLTLAMRDYIEMRDKDIVAQHQAGAGSLVWVPAGRTVRQVKVRTAHDLQAEFLAGEIARQRGASSGTDQTGKDGEPIPDTWDCAKSLVWTSCNPHG